MQTSQDLNGAQWKPFHSMCMYEFYKYWLPGNIGFVVLFILGFLLGAWEGQKQVYKEEHTFQAKEVQSGGNLKNLFQKHVFNQ